MNFRISFEKIDGVTPNDMSKVNNRPGYEHVNVHIIYDTFMEVSCLYQHLCYPIEGHIDQFYCAFRYLQRNFGKNLGRIAYNPIYEPADENLFKVVSCMIIIHMSFDHNIITKCL